MNSNFDKNGDNSKFKQINDEQHHKNFHTGFNNHSNNNNTNKNYNELINNMNSHLNFYNNTNNNNNKLNGHIFAQSSQVEQQPNLNRTKSSKLLDTISSAANTLFKPKVHKEQSSDQLFNETGLSKNVRLINSHDHGYDDQDSGLILHNNKYNQYNNSMDITSPPSSSNGINMNSNSAFQNYSKMNNMNNHYSGN